jgi:hypothetical protein
VGVTTDSFPSQVGPFSSEKRTDLSPVVLVLVLVLSEAVIENQGCADLGEYGVPRGRRVVD